MRALIFLPWLLATTHPFAAEKDRLWYVSPAGSDAGNGLLEQPFATIQRAQQSAGPGDTVMIRGGIYQIPATAIAKKESIHAIITLLDKSGTPERPITYRAFENEKPVFDCSLVKPEGRRVEAFRVTGSWLRLIGLAVTGVQVTIKGHTQSICFASYGSHNVLERLSMHDGQAIGIYHVRGSDNLFLNCDAWNNWDFTSEGGRGGNVDGFGAHPAGGSSGNLFRGCRAWFNSDDGFDCISAHEAVTFENCWAFYNGLGTDRKRLGDGNGFKIGGFGSARASRLPEIIPRHVVRGCLAVGNPSSGFYANHQPGGGDWFQNSAYRNGNNFNMLCRLADNRTDVDGYGHRLRNNLGFRGRTEITKLNRQKSESLANSFDLDLKLQPSDFLSLNETELTRPRQADGSLPTIDFLKPVPVSEAAAKSLGWSFTTPPG